MACIGSPSATTIGTPNPKPAFPENSVSIHVTNEFFLSMPRLSVIPSHIITVSTACDKVNVVTCRLRLRSLVAEWPLCLETQLGAASIAVVTKYTITVFPLHTEKVLHSFANTPLRVQCKTISPSSLIPRDQRRHGDPSGHDSPTLSAVF